MIAQVEAPPSLPDLEALHDDGEDGNGSEPALDDQVCTCRLPLHC